jgi:Nucleotide modification associated domain 1
MNTNEQYKEVIEGCKNIFISKAQDYGTSWRVYRTISVVDQIYIKAKRIRTIQEKKEQKIGDSITSEFKGILNYAVIGLIQLQLGEDDGEEIAIDALKKNYAQHVEIAFKLMLDKNHDYGEAWREMHQETFADMILARLQRIRQILLNEGKTIMSEGIDANFYDIINYSVFALILIGEGKHGE